MKTKQPRILQFGIETELAFVALDRQHRRVMEVLDEVERMAVSMVPHLRGEERGDFIVSGNPYREEAGDRTHTEFATAEVCQPDDAVRCAASGDLLLRRAAEQYLRAHPELAECYFSTHTTSYTKGGPTSWSSHQNHLTSRRNEDLAPEALGFLASCVCFAGGGGFDPFDEAITPVLSTRAMFTARATGGSTSSNRPLMHLDYKQTNHLKRGCTRFHAIAFDGLRSQKALRLRVASLALLLAVADRGVSFGPRVRLKDPAVAHRSYSRDVSLRAAAECEDEKARTAIEVQRVYVETVAKHAGELPAWAPAMLAEWSQTLDVLESRGLPGLATSHDCAIKHQIYTRHLAEHGLSWDDVGPAALQKRPRDRAALEKLRAELCLADNLFSQLDGEGIFNQLDTAGVLDHRLPGLDEAQIERAFFEPCAGTRAEARGRVILRYSGKEVGQRLQAGWSFVQDTATGRRLDLSDPYDADAGWESFRPEEGDMVAGDKVTR